MKTLDPFCQVRVGGLLYDSCRELSGEGISRAVDTLIRMEQELFTCRELVSDELHRLIGEVTGADRKRLIDIRRQLFNADYGAAAKSLDSLPGELRGRVRSQLGGSARALDSYVGTLARIVDIYARDLAHERAALASFADDPQFIAGVALSAAGLVPAIDRYAHNVVMGRTDRKDRKTERSLQSYILRAATKTSPFSRLGPLALVPRDAGRAGDDIAGGATRCVSRLSVYAVTRSLNNLASHPQWLGRLRVRISRFVHDDGGVLTVDRIRWTFKDIDSRDDYASSVESRVTIGQRPLTDAVSDILGDGQLPFSELTDRLVEASGLARGRVQELLGNLVRLGYLEIPSLVLHPHADVDEVVSALDEEGVGARLARLIREYRRRAEAFASIEDPRERLVELEELRLLLARLYEEAGVEGALPRSVVYEDVVVPACEIGGADAHTAFKDRDLPVLVQFLDLLDDASMKHALMRGYFESQKRARIPATDFIDDFIAELYDSFEGYDLAAIGDDDLAEDPWLRWGDAWRWVRARRDLVARLVGLCAGAPLGTCAAAGLELPDIDISRDLESALQYLPGQSPVFRHINVLVQRIPGEDDVVLNDSFGGIGFQVSRFTHALETDATEFTGQVEELARAQGVRLAEVSGGAVFTNLNLHEPLLSTQLRLPAEPGGSRSRSGLDLADLIVEDSAAEGRLILSDGAQQVHPVYSGYLVPAATPRRSQVATLFGPSANMSHKLSELVAPKPERGRVSLCPRMRIGNIVVARSRAIVHASDLPRANPMTAAGYLEWARFWSANAFPQRCFVRILADSEGHTKPAYFDVRLVVSCSALHNQVRDAGNEKYVEIAETLPDAATSTASSKDVISELMIGISLTEESI